MSWPIGDATHLAIEHFLLDARLPTAVRPDDLSIPDLIAARHGSFEAVKDVRHLQLRTFGILNEIVRYLRYASSDDHRLNLLYIAICIAMFNHPGSRLHDHANDLVLSALGDARFNHFLYSQRASDEQRRQATRLELYLHWSRLNPPLDSLANYSRYAFCDQRLPAALWSNFEPLLARAILAAEHNVEVDRDNPYAIQERSSTLSMKARLLAICGGQRNWREADQLQKASLRDLDRVSFPYGFAYPVQEYPSVKNKTCHAPVRKRCS